MVLGAGGLLGSSLLSELTRRSEGVRGATGQVWNSPDAVAAKVTSHLENCPDGTVWWAAGCGFVGATDEQMRLETSVLGSVAKAVAASDGRLVFASSAGGLFAGVAGRVVDRTTPNPVSVYGRAKLAQEGLLSDLLPGRHVACRISNIYGSAQQTGKPQGLITAAVRAACTGRPMNLFVPMSNLRDFVLVDDLADAMVNGVSDGSATDTHLFTSAVSVPLSVVFALIHKVSGRRVPCTMRPNPSAAEQPRALVFGDSLRRFMSRHPTPLDIGIARLVSATRREILLGRLR